MKRFLSWIVALLGIPAVAATMTLWGLIVFRLENFVWSHWEKLYDLINRLGGFLDVSLVAVIGTGLLILVAQGVMDLSGKICPSLRGGRYIAVAAADVVVLLGAAYLYLTGRILQDVEGMLVYFVLYALGVYACKLIAGLIKERREKPAEPRRVYVFATAEESGLRPYAYITGGNGLLIRSGDGFAIDGVNGEGMWRAVRQAAPESARRKNQMILGGVLEGEDVVCTDLMTGLEWEYRLGDMRFTYMPSSDQFRREPVRLPWDSVRKLKKVPYTWVKMELPAPEKAPEPAAAPAAKAAPAKSAEKPAAKGKTTAPPPKPAAAAKAAPSPTPVPKPAAMPKSAPAAGKALGGTQKKTTDRAALLAELRTCSDEEVEKASRGLGIWTSTVAQAETLDDRSLTAILNARRMMKKAPSGAGGTGKAAPPAGKLPPVCLYFDPAMDPKGRQEVLQAVQELPGVFPRLEIRLMPDPAEPIAAGLINDKGQYDGTAILRRLEKLQAGLPKGSPALYFTDRDLILSTGRWCFGAASLKKGASVQSLYRYRDLSMAERERCIRRTLRHELGHVLGMAGDPSRSNTEERYGCHCTNPGCSMRQTPALRDLLALSAEEEKLADPFCAQCREEMRRRWAGTKA